MPFPLGLPVTLSHVALLVAVHEQPDGMVTFVDPVPAVAATAWLGGENEMLHGAAAWFTVNVCPPIVSVPERGVPFGFGIALKFTGPSPVPPVAPVTVNHAVLLLTAVHEQVDGTAETLVTPGPPPEPTD